jgi:hypothetical protein
MKLPSPTRAKPRASVNGRVGIALQRTVVEASLSLANDGFLYAPESVCPCHLQTCIRELIEDVWRFGPSVRGLIHGHTEIDAARLQKLP